MKLNSNKVIHFWDFKPNNCVKIEKKFMKKLLSEILSYPEYHYKTAELMNIDESVVNDIRRNPEKKIEINTIKKIIEFLKKIGKDMELKDIEPHIIWIGSHTGRGISDPKLPFVVNCTNFAKILSASFGDGTITNISYSTPKKYKLGVLEYTNEDPVLRQKLINSALKVFGGNKKEYVIRYNNHGTSVYFPSIIRDTLLIAGGIRGKKSIHNPSIPSWIMNLDRDMWITWLKQTLDDEGSVRFRDNYGHEIFVTRVMDITEVFPRNLRPGTKISFKKLPKKEQQIIPKNPVCLLSDEFKLLKKLGIESRLKPQEIYVTKKGRIKVKWRLYITRKENLKKFAKLINFTSSRKRKILERIVGENVGIQTKNY